MVDIRVVIERDDGKEVYMCLTDQRGRFSFPKLRPGHWHIHIASDSLPSLHELDINNLVIEIKPEENRHVLFKVIPKSPSFQKLE